ncbi:helix-turn-helix domain-containing protein [Photorhabdus heterorhabditis]
MSKGFGISTIVQQLGISRCTVYNILK